MALVPVFCDNCGTVWATPNFIGGSSGMISMTGSKVGPCPACGGDGSVPDGLYHLQDDQLEIDPTPEWRERLQRVIGIVEHARDAGGSENDVRAQVEREAP